MNIDNTSIAANSILVDTAAGDQIKYWTGIFEVPAETLKAAVEETGSNDPEILENYFNTK